MEKHTRVILKYQDKYNYDFKHNISFVTLSMKPVFIMHNAL